MSDVTTTASYGARRAQLETYFDRTASETWARLTSDAPVSRIRQTVRRGRDEMRSVMLSWLPDDLRGVRVLDAGCGTGAMAVELAARGADVVAVDVAASLVEIAAKRAPEGLPGRIDWHAGDMLDPSLGAFDHAVAMDSLIHYRRADMVAAIAAIAARCTGATVVTFAPRTALLSAMHLSGKAFPRSDRSPAIEPVREARLAADIAALPGLQPGRTQRVSAGFYISQALEVVRT